MKEEISTYASWKYVDSRKEAADLFIMNYAVKGDITVTHLFNLKIEKDF
jgi:uncharacterized protein YaiI (UPF0178 family)